MKNMVTALFISTVAAAAFVAGSSNIDPAHKVGWGENVGWSNWLDANGTTDGVFVDTANNFLSGNVWAENVGWINVGHGGPYANTDDTNYGVNIEGDDDLTGYAWGENVGWVNFGWGAAGDLTGRARFDGAAQRFRGYAWGENIGWINLDDDTHYVGVTGIPVCNVKADCADLNNNNLRDDPCLHWTCGMGACSSVPVVYGDIGGPAGPGRCDPDGSPDNNDAFHALNCFSNSNFGLPGNYPCDDANLPMNADIGGAALTCCPDGACDNNDRFLALTAFSAGGGPVGPNMCACPLNSPPGSVICPLNATAPYAPRFTDQATLLVVSSSRRAKAGDMVSVDVFIADAVRLQGYQLHLGVSGGRRGSLELVDIAIDDRNDFVYGGLPFVDAYNVKTHQMLADHDEGAVATKANAYLATFTYRVSADAAGTFVIDVLGYESDKRENRTFLFGPIDEGMVELVGSKAAVVVVTGSR